MTLSKNQFVRVYSLKYQKKLNKNKKPANILF